MYSQLVILGIKYGIWVLSTWFFVLAYYLLLFSVFCIMHFYLICKLVQLMYAYLYLLSINSYNLQDNGARTVYISQINSVVNLSGLIYVA